MPGTRYLITARTRLANFSGNTTSVEFCTCTCICLTTWLFLKPNEQCCIKAGLWRDSKHVFSARDLQSKLNGCFDKHEFSFLWKNRSVELFIETKFTLYRAELESFHAACVCRSFKRWNNQRHGECELPNAGNLRCCKRNSRVVYSVCPKRWQFRSRVAASDCIERPAARIHSSARRTCLAAANLQRDCGN